MKMLTLFFVIFTYFGLAHAQNKPESSPCDQVKCVPGYRCVELGKRISKCVPEQVEKCRRGTILNIEGRCVPLNSQTQ